MNSEANSSGGVIGGGLRPIVESGHAKGQATRPSVVDLALKKHQEEARYRWSAGCSPTLGGSNATISIES
jgi:hypothetical protein